MHLICMPLLLLPHIANVGYELTSGNNYWAYIAAISITDNISGVL